MDLGVSSRVFIRIFQVDRSSLSGPGIKSSKLRTSPVVWCGSYCSAFLTFPCSIIVPKFRAITPSSDGLDRVVR